MPPSRHAVGSARWPDQQRPRTGWTQQRFVSGYSQQIDILLAHGNRYYSRGLSGVDQEREPQATGEAAHLFDGLDSAGDVAAVRAGDQSRARRNGGRNGVGIRQAVTNHADPCQSYRARLGQGLQRPRHAVVFEHGGDGMIARPQHALDGHVERIRGGSR